MSVIIRRFITDITGTPVTLSSDSSISFTSPQARSISSVTDACRYVVWRHVWLTNIDCHDIWPLFITKIRLELTYSNKRPAYQLATLENELPKVSAIISASQQCLGGSREALRSGTPQGQPASVNQRRSLSLSLSVSSTPRQRTSYSTTVDLCRTSAQCICSPRNLRLRLGFRKGGTSPSPLLPPTESTASGSLSSPFASCRLIPLTIVINSFKRLYDVKIYSIVTNKT